MSHLVGCYPMFDGIRNAATFSRGCPSASGRPQVSLVP